MIDPFLNCNFSYDHYTSILIEAKKFHKFSTFEDYSDNDVILRHDVDVSLDAAVKMAKIENRLGISATYFILFHAELYNPFNYESLRQVSEFLKLGHKIGLHYNPSLYQTKSNSSKILKKEIELTELHYETQINVVSSHDPSINKKLSIELPHGIIDAYDEEFTINRKYLSDSVQNWREGCFCNHINKREKFQILIHPIW